jgi:oligoribonuclease
MSNIAFIDVETDSLDAHNGHLLEIACLVTDENLNVLDKRGYHAGVYYIPSDVDDMRYAADPVVQEMHDKTGLWKKLSGTDATPLPLIDRDLRRYLAKFGEPGTMPVGGNSVRLDMNFIDKHLPQVSEYLHYQMRDVTTVAKLAQDWYPDLPEFEKISDHTAMVDIQESIRELQYYREVAFKASFAKMPQWERDEVTADVMSYLLSVGYTITAPGGGEVSETEYEYEYAWLADEEKRKRMKPQGPKILFDKSFYDPETIMAFPKGKRVRRRGAGPWEEVSE